MNKRGVIYLNLEDIKPYENNHLKIQVKSLYKSYDIFKKFLE
nr:hypothetical protein NZ312_09240 [Clostridioides difficile]